MRAKFEFEGSYKPQKRIAYGTLFTPLLDDSLLASRKDYSVAEPALDYGASLPGALAAWVEHYCMGPWGGVMEDEVSRPKAGYTPKPKSCR